MNTMNTTTQCYLPYGTSEHTPFPCKRGQYLIYLPMRDGRLSWPGWIASIFLSCLPQTGKISPRRIRVTWRPWTWVLDALCLHTLYPVSNQVTLNILLKSKNSSVAHQFSHRRTAAHCHLLTVRRKISQQWNVCVLHAKHGNLVDADAPGAKASTKHLESRLEVTQGHASWVRKKRHHSLVDSFSKY